MKKHILALGLALLLLCGCGKTEAAEAPRAESAEIVTEAPEEQPGRLPWAPADDDGFGDLLLAETDDCTVLLTGYDPDGPDGPILKVWLLNRREDVTMRFAAGNGVANGFVCGPRFDAAVGPRQAAEAEVLWPAEHLAELGVNYLQSVAFRLVVFDDGDPAADSFVDEEVLLHLPGGEGPAVTEVPRSFPKKRVAQDERCTVEIVDYEPAGELGPEVTLRIYNRTLEETLLFSLEECVVNGIMCDPGWAMEVPSSAEAFAVVTWPAEQLEEVGIGWIQDVTAQLRVCNAAEADPAFLMDETVTFSLPRQEGDAVIREGRDSDDLFLARGDCWSVSIRDVVTGEEGQILVLWITNTSDRALRFDASEVTVNGAACEPWWGTTVAPSSEARSELVLSPSLLEGIGVETASEAGFTLTVRDADDWTAEDLFRENVRAVFAE